MLIQSQSKFWYISISENVLMNIKMLNFIIFLSSLFFVISLSASPDPFMGEGKQGFINRCTSSSEMPGQSPSEIEEFCKCFANNLEIGYQDALKSIKPTDTISLAQQKMNDTAKKYAKACMP